MKKIFISIFTSIIALCAVAQDLPQGIAYQAVAVKEGPYSVAGENPQAIYWSNKDIKVRFTILDQYPNPMDTYQEYHSVTTDDYGVFNLIIGQGTVISGDFETIPWELGTAHLRVEIDFDNDDNYTVTSIERFWSVPYAFVSKKDESTNIDSALLALNDKITYLKNRDQDTVIGNEGITYKTIDSLNQVLQAKIDVLRANDLDTVVGNEIQTLAINGDSLSISDGNTVKIDLPSNLDNDPVNEIQSLTIKGDSLSISDGNTVMIDFPTNLDNDSTNEIQTISLTNDTINLSDGGGSVVIPKNWTLKDSTLTNNSKYVHVGNSTTDSSAILNVSSTSAGLLIPRMSSSQRTGINSPANGLLVFDIQTKTFWYYSGQWIELASSNSSSSKSTNSETLIFTVNGF
ncbi:hypothetical protein OAZ27_02650 [Bacteroidia bacterium]|nr:hypothetical protein [Bacteroidia bacterium]